MSTLAMPSMEQVLALAELCPVFPVRVWKDAQTGKLRKAPAINGGRGHLDASKDRNTVIGLFTRANGWNAIGVPTGLASGFDILDGDEQHETARSWFAANPLPATRTHHTASGGRHFFFAHREGQRSFTDSPVKGVDGRGDGGWVVWWPANGLPVENPNTLAQWPANLQIGIRTANARTVPVHVEVPPMPEHEARLLCDGIVASKAYARKHVRRETWMALLRNLIQLGVPDTMAWDVWDKVYEGDNKPSDDKEAAKWAADGGAIGPGSLIAHCKDILTGDARSILVKHATEYQQKSAETEFRQSVTGAMPQSQTTTRSVQLSTYEPPPIAWCIPGMRPCVGTGFIFGDHSAGKTALEIDFIAARTCKPGQLWAGREVKPLGPDEIALIVGFEDHRSIKERAIAAAKHRGSALSPNIHLLMIDGGKQAVQAISAEMGAQRRLGRKCTSVMIDTWSAARFTLDDNNANEVAAVISEFDKMALEHESCISFLDHIVKNNETGRYTPRGSGVKLPNTSFGYAIDDGRLIFEKVKNTERVQEVRFETAKGDGAVIVKWSGVTMAERMQSTWGGHNNKEDSVKTGVASYALGVGIEDNWTALDAGKFVRFNPEVHNGYLQGLSDDVVPTIAMICTRGVFGDALAGATGDNDATIRKRVGRLKDRGHILIIGAGKKEVPLVLMRGEGWLPQNPWAPKNNPQKMPWDA